ncbi:MAG: LutB/LldF family L-lactate oxidation iron-sulfur protein [Bacteroidales bacterium]|jgi:L-lactate dehydrogenase complex protein LldF|nr:iron-sulfur cluster-binding protein [Lentimicrobiaceae bacterium]MDG1136563.1 LutB/LldF family L-lactate oxidation iron-sulfur protein [Bacteroidales bacterium]MDG1902446.1 LutB/LldF family L-lactate oxidation iron-sulfur protein [Bacteroidales bacterium]MDG2081916.1 LutB/LldF family L-lactate oxidation iron-sulfur protein [Bacteroidales bacterium]|tara:strand:- start:25731 stop:27119 length:1389 start_codon:yes stop_codon:yes gene_type:complete
MKSSIENKSFLARSEKIAFDDEHREKIKFNISRYNKSVEKGQQLYSQMEIARDRAGFLKYKIINELDSFLIEFEDNFTANGGKVIWAQNSDEALKEILKIAEEYNIQSAVKSKSMTTEEIDLNDSLSKNNIEITETDLGEFIVQQANQKPYHIVTPAMHMSKEDVAKLYNEKFNTPDDMSPEELTLYTRKLLREKFTSADLGITGANFLISDTGSIAITENEGNGMLSMSFPKTHIAIAGIEKLIPKLEDLDLFWPLLSVSGTGQPMTVYNSIISGPKRNGETDGPDQMYIVLIDNGRSSLLKQERQRQALSCIRCGACLNSCPVYKNVGGHTYKTTYSGPIGSVITPYLSGEKKYKHLSFASSLCGKCTTVCPVKIPLHELLLVNRNDSVKKGFYTFFEKQTINISSQALKSRRMLDLLSGKTKNKILNKAVSKTWGPRRVMPEIAPKSFNQLWKERNNND